MAVWARNAERWDALPKLWTLCAETSEFVPAEFYAVFAELPTEARGAAGAHLDLGHRAG